MPSTSVLLVATLMANQAALPAPANSQTNAPNVSSTMPRVTGVPAAERRPVDYSPDYDGVLFRMEIGGREAWAILDNLNPRTLVDPAFARAAGLSLTAAPSPATVTMQDQEQAAVEAWLVEPTTLLFPGQVEFSNIPLGAMDLSSVARGTQRIDAIIGRDILGGMALGLNPISHSFSLAPGGSARGMPGAISLPFSGSQFEIMVGTTPLSLFFSLNVSGNVSLTPAAWARVAPEGAELEQRTRLGPGGQSHNVGYGLLPPFTLGTLQQPETEVAVLPWNDQVKDGVVGARFYDRFITLMDPKQGRIWFLPRVSEEPAS